MRRTACPTCGTASRCPSAAGPTPRSTTGCTTAAPASWSASTRPTASTHSSPTCSAPSKSTPMPSSSPSSTTAPPTDRRTTMTVTVIIVEDLIRRYADDIAYVAEETPAADLGAFIDQLDTAASRYSMAGINGYEDLQTAAVHLNEARDSA